MHTWVWQECLLLVSLNRQKSGLAKTGAARPAPMPMIQVVCMQVDKSVCPSIYKYHYSGIETTAAIVALAATLFRP